MPTAPLTMSKGEFAALCNVDKSRVSHWIKDGRISGSALSGTGRSARIVVATAQAQLRGRLDPYQMLPTGNGSKTKLDTKPATAPITNRPVAGELLSNEADRVWSVLAEMPSAAAWHMAEQGETTQRAYDLFENLKLYALAVMRMRGFNLDEDAFEPVNWPGLAEEMGLILIDPVNMEADWQRRRAED